MSFALDINYFRGRKELERYSLAKKLDSYRILTIKAPVYSKFEISNFEEIGVSFREALLEFIGKHPSSKLNQTCFNNMAGLEAFVKQEVEFIKTTEDNYSDPE